jgi:polar amino acid transport system substrate-binding protein
MPRPFVPLFAALTLAAGLVAAPLSHAEAPDDEEPSALERVTARGALDVAVYRDFPPFSYSEQGRTVGIDVDIARALAERLGVAASVRAVGADENLEDDLRNNVWKGHYLGGGVADLMLHVPYDDELGRRNDQVLLLAPYFREQIVVAVPAGRSGVASLLDLFTEQKVGVELDTLSDFYLLSAYGGGIREQVVHFRSLSEAGAALRRGELGGIVGPRSEVETALGEDRAAYSVGPVQMPGMRLSGWDLGGAVKEGADDLAQAIEQAMAALREAGEIERIFARHGVTWQMPSRVPMVQSTGDARTHADPTIATGVPAPRADRQP